MYMGRMSKPADPALQWFLDDAKRQGLSIREYEKRNKIILMPREHELSTNEFPIENAPVGAPQLLVDPLDSIEPEPQIMVRVDGRTLLVNADDMSIADCLD